MSCLARRARCVLTGPSHQHTRQLAGEIDVDLLTQASRRESTDPVTEHRPHVGTIAGKPAAGMTARDAIPCHYPLT